MTTRRIRTARVWEQTNGSQDHRGRARDGRGRTHAGEIARACAEALEPRYLLAALTIAQENALPGTPQSTWDITRAGDSTIQGFATDISVNVGQTVNFKVDDQAKVAYHLDIYRMGYYQGNGARKITTISSASTLKVAQPAPLKVAATGLTDCGNWSVTASWQVPADATSGIYFANVTREDTGGTSRIVFVVRNDASHSDLLLQTSDTTWQAYNTYGGNSLYEGSTGLFPGQSDPNRAAKVSYNRPLTLENSDGGYGTYNSPFHSEYPMVRWLERNGYDVSYFTDVDSDRNGALIKNHKTYLSVGHDEYWSAGQRNNVEAARDAGVNLAFFSGNESFWKVRWENSVDSSGTPYRTLVCYKESKTGTKLDPTNVWTGTWRDSRLSPPYDGGRPENAMSGTLYMDDRTSTDIGIPMTVPGSFANLRFWRNTAVASLSASQTATLGTAVVGYEVDEDQDNGFRPAGLIDMSSTTFSTPSHVTVPWGTEVGPGTSTHSITLYRAPSGALVFGAGTIQWAWGLDGTHLDGASTANATMQQATVNLLADMGAQPASLQSGLVAATASTDLTPPTSTITSPANGAVANKGVAVTITGTASDAGGGIVAGVEVSTDSGATWHPATGRNSWSYTWIPATSGTVRILSRATDDSARIETPGPGITVSVPAPVPVAAYGFEEGAGTTTADSSGNANTGTIAGATWTTAGKYGKALVFNGSSSMVSVPDANALDLTAGMTLEAWVKPNSLSGWTTVVMKERPGGLAYSLYASDDTNHPPVTYANVGSSGDLSALGTTALPLSTWSFVTGTYDGLTLRLYVNGTLVGTKSISGNINTSTSPLRIGGNSVWGEYFNGTLDEIRVYKAALSPQEIQNDMNTPVAGPADTTAPSVSVTAPAGGATLSGTTTVSATASDNIGIAGVQFLLNGNPLGAEDTAAPYSFSWDTTSVANGAYVITARARDAAGNATTSSQVNVTVSNVDSTPPTVTARTPAPGATGVAVSATVTATFSEAVQANTISLILKDGANNTVPATVTYNATTRTVTLTPGAALAANTTYTATLSGAQDLAGNAMAPATWSFTTATADTTAPTVTAQSPAPGATGVGTGTGVTATFSEAVQSATIAFVLRDSSNNVVSTTFTYDGATFTATLTPAGALAAGTTYTATLSGARDLAGNSMSPVTWSFTTLAIGNSSYSLWPNSTLPSVAADTDASSVELGVKFRTDVAGVITGIRFYKGSTNTGTHVGNLWSSSGALLASATFVSESASGWQLVSFASPVSIAANTTYIASYLAPNGHYAADGAYFATAGVDSGPLHAPSDSAAGGNGVYNYGPTSAFPGSTYNASNYWVDVVFSPVADNTPPTVVSTSPTSGATRVSPSAALTVRFSEAMDPASIGTGTIELRDSANVLVPATVSYNASTLTVTLTPATALANGAAYTLRVKSGAAGVKDVSGNPLAADYVSTFTTAGQWQQTTAADFGGGTNAGTTVTNDNGGEVQLAPSYADDFTGSALRATDWSTTPWAGGTGTTAVTVSGGVLSIGRAEVLSTQVVTNTPVEARLIIPAGRNFNFGLATDVVATTGQYSAVFTTRTTSTTLYARVNVNGTLTDASLGAIPTGYHVYRIQPTATGFQFYIDGVLKRTTAKTLPAGTQTHIALSVQNATPALQADWVRLAAYPAAGTFTSSVFDAGRTATWLSASWNASLPAGTSIVIETRSGGTSTPDDGSWSAWSAVASDGTVTSTAGRYLQYRVRLVSTDPSQSAVLNDIRILWA